MVVITKDKSEKFNPETATKSAKGKTSKAKKEN